jgi:hypothetical protein
LNEAITLGTAPGESFASAAKPPVPMCSDRISPFAAHSANSGFQ